MIVTPAMFLERERNPLQGMFAFKKVLEADLRLCNEARRFGYRSAGVLQLSENTLTRELDKLLDAIDKVKNAEDAICGHDVDDSTNGQ